MSDAEQPSLEIVEDHRPQRPDDSIRRVSRDILTALTESGSWAGWTAEGQPIYGDEADPVPDGIVQAEGAELAILAGMITMQLLAAQDASIVDDDGLARRMVREAAQAAEDVVPQPRRARRASARRKRRR